MPARSTDPDFRPMRWVLGAEVANSLEPSCYDPLHASPNKEMARDCSRAT